MCSTTAARLCFAFCTFVGCAMIGLCGCRSYHLGHPATLPFESVFIEPAANESYAPQAQAIVSANIREVIIRDSRVKLLASREEADLVIEIVLTEYSKRSATRDPNDTEAALSFGLSLVSEVSLYDRRAKEYIFQNRRVEERGEGFVNNIYSNATTPDTQSFIQSEYQAIPRIARDLASKIADEVLSAW